MYLLVRPRSRPLPKRLLADRALNNPHSIHSLIHLNSSLARAVLDQDNLLSRVNPDNSQAPADQATTHSSDHQANPAQAKTFLPRPQDPDSKADQAVKTFRANLGSRPVQETDQANSRFSRVPVGSLAGQVL